MKQKIITALLEQIQSEATKLKLASESAHQAATHEESRQEDKHDTRSVEASYLAAGHAKRLSELDGAIRALHHFSVRPFGPGEPVAIGALLELSHQNTRHWYFLCPVGGGYKIDLEGKTVNIISPQSLLGEELLDKIAGDEVNVTTNITRSYEIVSVR